MARRRRARVGRAPPSTPAQSAVTTGWLTAVIAEVLVIFPLYGWLSSGGSEPLDRFLAAYVPILPFLGGALLVGTLPPMIVASALARRFEVPLMRAPVLWAHLSAD
ncbi:hypothetical protein [Wenxinia marina]|uniref:Uncharacterized protein n=1 Tax=Wenxinia marina DSM 24838 TaxID=1123501 RepID=A0A0D0PBS9_9RHOB|nr:hypothetical protein [Wenxinia marina]KIQ68916.1 hypothetical protein Wenmar_02648 [Wenxinia marina DSM 24838]GGL64183.1 hypothetical protein GCM10011392_18540 [Wenxinia marina]